MHSHHTLFLPLFVGAIIISACAVKVYAQEFRRSDLALGHRLPGDSAIETKTEKARGPSDYIFNYYKTYTGNNEYIITRVVVKDVSEHGSAYSDSFAAIVAGGPGSTYVTVAYTVPRLVDMMFNVTVFGKPPVLRKIV